MKSQNHRERIIELIQLSGDEGIHSFQLSRWVTHKATTRVSELRAQGYPISVKKIKGGTEGAMYYWGSK